MWGTNLRQQGISWLHQNLAYSEYHKPLFLAEPSSKMAAKIMVVSNYMDHTISHMLDHKDNLKKKKKELFADAIFYRGHPFSQAITNRIKGTIPMASSRI